MPTETAHQSIAYEDVIDLLDIDHPESWDDNAIYPPYILKLDGIYAKPAYRLRGLSQEELSALRPWFPPGYYGNYSKPVLALPCMSQDFVEFIAGAELWDRVMYPSGEFIEAWREHGLPDCDTSAKPKAALNMPASETLLPEAGPEPFRFKTQRDRSGYTDMARELAERFYRETGRNATASEAWTSLIANPLDWYPITTNRNPPFRYVTLPGEDKLDKKEFNRRWKRWTSVQ